LWEAHDIETTARLVLHDDLAFLDRAIQSVREAGPVFALVSRLPWHGEAGDWERAARTAEEAGAEVVLGDCNNEADHRRAALAHATVSINPPAAARDTVPKGGRTLT